MKIKRHFWALAGLALLGQNCWGQAFKPLHFQMSAFTKTDNQSKSENSHIWVKGPTKFRIEQVVGAQTIVTIGNGADIWQVDLLSKKCQHSKAADLVRKIGKQTIEGVDILPTFKKQGGKRSGQGKVDGVVCTTYKRHDKDGVDYTLWILPEGKLRRMVMTGVLTGAAAIGESMSSHVVESRNDIKWLDASKMDEALFRPPAGMTVTEAPNAR